MNLAIPRGTGVATYARSLGACLDGMGHEIDLLFGMDTAAATPPDVAFFEQLHTERGYRRPKYPTPAWICAMLRARSGETAKPITLTGRVEARPFAGRLPPHDRILNSDNLFGRATHYFRVFGRFMHVRIPNPPAIMHWTYPIPVHLEGARNIYTVHDLVPLRMPYATLDHKPTHVKLLRTCIDRGDHILTVSDRSREDLFAFFPDADRDRVSNTYQALAPTIPALDPAHITRLLRDGFGLTPGGYFLFFGSIEPKKNVARLLQAFLASDLAIPLVIVTARGWQAGAEAALLDRAPDDRRIRRIEYVDADILATLIKGARAVTFPSLYEGFGLPVVEAMQAGTPVLTSREGSLPEVGGDAVLYVDAYDVASIAAGLMRLATDDALYADLQAQGPQQAERFSMPHYAEQLEAVYETVLGRPTRPG